MSLDTIAGEAEQAKPETHADKILRLMKESLDISDRFVNGMKKLVKQTPNDQELGEKVRQIYGGE